MDQKHHSIFELEEYLNLSRTPNLPSGFFSSFYSKLHQYLRVLSHLSNGCNLTDEKLLKAYKFYQKDLNSNIFVSVTDNIVVGTSSLFLHAKFSHHSSCVGYIEDVVVLPEYRKQGIATDLINHCVNNAKINGCYKVVLNCNLNLVSFYEKLGFKVIGTECAINL